MASSTSPGAGARRFERRRPAWPGSEPINVATRCITTGISIVGLLALLLALIFFA